MVSSSLAVVAVVENTNQFYYHFKVSHSHHKSTTIALKQQGVIRLMRSVKVDWNCYCSVTVLKVGIPQHCRCKGFSFMVEVVDILSSTMWHLPSTDTDSQRVVVSVKVKSIRVVAFLGRLVVKSHQELVHQVWGHHLPLDQNHFSNYLITMLRDHPLSLLDSFPPS